MLYLILQPLTSTPIYHRYDPICRVTTVFRATGSDGLPRDSPIFVIKSLLNVWALQR